MVCGISESEVWKPPGEYRTGEHLINNIMSSLQNITEICTNTHTEEKFVFFWVIERCSLVEIS